MIDNEIVLYDSIRPVRWQADGLYLLDQRKLPDEEVYLHITGTQALYQAIKDMVVRGAPAIGIAAAYGAVIAATESKQAGRADFQTRLDLLASSRPTAVNLFNALKAAKQVAAQSAEPISSLLAWADAWLADDITANKAIGAYGARCFAAGSRVLTHCNAGALATGGYGTALGVIRKAYQNGQLAHVYSAETRPWNQGSRLSLWEFEQENIPATLIADSAAASLMQKGLIDWIVVGADSICRNGDIANKIGTYSLAVLAKHHGVKLMVAAPTTTIDLSAESGNSIVIEQRAASEILPANYVDGVVSALNPVFDVTPAHLISAIVTEKGVIESPDASKMRALTE